MKCPGCGEDVVERAVYCHLCGERLDSLHGENNDPESADNDARFTAFAEDGVAAQQSYTGHTHGDSRAWPAGAQRFRDAFSRNGDVEEANLWEGGYSAKAMMGNWIFGCALTLGFLTLGFWAWGKWDVSIIWWVVLVAITISWLYLLILLLYRRLGVHYRLTSERFFHERGVLRHTTDLIEVIDMDDITFEQSLIDRITGVGSVRIVSSDRSHPELTIHGIENVKDVASKMHDARHAERLRRGLHIEQI